MVYGGGGGLGYCYGGGSYGYGGDGYGYGGDGGGGGGYGYGGGYMCMLSVSFSNIYPCTNKV